MTELEKFLKANEESHIVRSAWTVNGRTCGRKPPEEWNFMRITLKDGNEFLLSRDEVNQIGEFATRWEPRK